MKKNCQLRRLLYLKPNHDLRLPEPSFKEHRAPILPTPTQIRALNKAPGNIRATEFSRPLPVEIQTLGLFVKYGVDVTIVEAQTKMMAREQVGDRVHIHEVFGWVEDGGPGV
ncbi:hypothetical protein FQN54_009631 [Arachnomyces sp. PD_36]|nr:hypothetical protein FQN54_009631 [Arachnomyces sp. PD_36]